MKELKTNSERELLEVANRARELRTRENRARDYIERIRNREWHQKKRIDAFVDTVFTFFFSLFVIVCVFGGVMGCFM